MGANGPLGVASFGPRGLIGRIYVGSTKHCYLLNIQAVVLMVSEKKIFFFLYKSMGANDPRGVRPVWTPRAFATY